MTLLQGMTVIAIMGLCGAAWIWGYEAGVEATEKRRWSDAVAKDEWIKKYGS